MNSFTIYEEYYDLITLLPNEKEQQELLLAIVKYMFKDAIPTLNDNQMKIFNNLRRPLEKSKKRSKCGSITKSNDIQKENKTKSNENQKENKTKSNENQKENKSKSHQDVNVYVNNNVNVNNLEEIGYGEEEPLLVTSDVGSLTEITSKVLDHLNEKTGSKFRSSTESTQKKINARLNEGYKLDDFIVVIDKKCKEWIGTEFENFLRPETLFGTKFESYLNQKNTKTQKKEQVKYSEDWWSKV